MIEEIRDFLKREGLLKNGKIGVNYLSEKPLHYTVDEVPTDPVIKRYTDGGSLRQCLFVIASREEFSPAFTRSFPIGSKRFRKRERFRTSKTRRSCRTVWKPSRRAIFCPTTSARHAFRSNAALFTGGNTFNFTGGTT